MNKRFGYQFWKDLAEVSSYAFVALSLAGDALFARKYIIISGLIIVGSCIIMMIVEEFKSKL